MNISNRHHIQFRYGLITLLILLFSAAISYKLFSTTVIDAPKWNEKARRQLEKVDTIMPERGDILSDKGQILATNLRYYTVRIDFRCDNFKQNAYLENIDALADSMAAAFRRCRGFRDTQASTDWKKPSTRCFTECPVWRKKFL